MQQATHLLSIAAVGIVTDEVGWMVVPAQVRLTRDHFVARVSGGSMVFGIGLDDGPAEESDDVTVMPRVLYERRWSQYATDVATTFDIEDGGRIEIRSRR